ncbi:unnamed protein product [Vicia faba]|uniref:Uncharacterized protein n=1 Tax=Vicia faba TaxID=3906 RepID=A0AAV0YUP9_VICFA|nr:unnamed protein product [Vicia faba]
MKNNYGYTQGRRILDFKCKLKAIEFAEVKEILPATISKMSNKKTREEVPTQVIENGDEDLAENKVLCCRENPYEACAERLKNLKRSLLQIFFGFEGVTSWFGPTLRLVSECKRS